MYFLSLVGIWFGSPLHSSQRLSKVWTVWMNGTFMCRPGSVCGWPTGSPNWVMMTCSVSLIV